MDDKEKTALYTKKQKNVIGKWMAKEMSEVAESLRNEFMESGQVTESSRKKIVSASNFIFIIISLFFK